MPLCRVQKVQKNTPALQMLIGVPKIFNFFRTLSMKGLSLSWQKLFLYKPSWSELEAIQRGRQIHLDTYQHRGIHSVKRYFFPF